MIEQTRLLRMWGRGILVLMLFCASLSPAADNVRYLVVADANELPAGVKGAIQDAGGEILSVLPQVGVVTAQASDADFKLKASKIKGIKWVVQDHKVRWVKPDPSERYFLPENVVSPGDETFWSLQWAPKAIQAPQAWALGVTGNGVRVAILDGGIPDDHVDLDDNLDFSACTSFVPGVEWYEDISDFWHGPHVAGIVAAEDNGVGTVGVAPKATIIAVKVLHGGSGYFSWLIEGVVYAAYHADADIINISAGYPFNKKEMPEATKLASILGRVMTYAYQNGAVVVASAGNESLDLDHDSEYLVLPAEVEHVLSISATGPVDFWSGGTNFTRPASYTNYGVSAIDFAAPGGDFVLYPVGYWYLDMVLAPTRLYLESIKNKDGSWQNDWSWAAGTSQAAPHVAGVAALVIEASGGSMHPSQVETILRQSADDLGKNGSDDYYGKGFVNAEKAVQLAFGLKKKTVPLISDSPLPDSYELGQNNPNPFNPHTQIAYEIPEDGYVLLEIYDINGRLVRVLENSYQTAGKYTRVWDGKNDWNAPVPSGTYFYQITADEFRATRKMLLIK